MRFGAMEMVRIASAYITPSYNVLNTKATIGSPECLVITVLDMDGRNSGRTTTI
jgi:hypothetical protein